MALVLNVNTKRDTGRSAQLANIGAAQAVAGIVRSTLGPRAMLKMLLDPMGGIVITNDANAILREVDVSHPAAKQMIELSRAQDEEVGDGTTSVIVLTGEMMQVAEPLLQRNIHPTVICRGYARALDAALSQWRRLPLMTEFATHADSLANSFRNRKMRVSSFHVWRLLACREAFKKLKLEAAMPGEPTKTAAAKARLDAARKPSEVRARAEDATDRKSVV